MMGASSSCVAVATEGDEMATMSNEITSNGREGTERVSLVAEFDGKIGKAFLVSFESRLRVGGRGKGRASIAKAAEALGMQERDLAAHLRAEGISLR
jgi:hypothetical protein